MITSSPCPGQLRHFQGRYMEAPRIFKREGLYYLIASDCTGLHPNEARSAVAPDLADRGRNWATLPR